MSMPSEIAEQQWGRYTNQMVFSRITTCTTLICLMSGTQRLMGAHFVMVRGDLPDYDAVLNGLRVLKGSDTIQRMYLVRVGQVWDHLPASSDYAPARFRSSAQPDTFRTALGYDGEVWIRETSGAGKGDTVSVAAHDGGAQVSVNGTPLRDDQFTINQPAAQVQRPGFFMRLFGRLCCCCCKTTGD